MIDPTPRRLTLPASRDEETGRSAGPEGRHKAVSELSKVIFDLSNVISNLSMVSPSHGQKKLPDSLNEETRRNEALDEQYKAVSELSKVISDLSKIISDLSMAHPSIGERPLSAQVDDILPIPFAESLQPSVDERPLSASRKKESRRSGTLGQPSQNLSKSGKQPSIEVEKNLPNFRNKETGKSGTLEALSKKFSDQNILSPSDIEEKTWETLQEKQPSSARVKITLLALGIAMFTTPLIWLRYGHEGGTPQGISEKSTKVYMESKAHEFVENTEMDDIQNSAIEVVQGFMSAKSPEDAVPYIIGGEKRLPQLQEYYARPEISYPYPNGFKRVEKQLTNAIEGIFYQVIFAADQDDVVHQFAIVPSGDQMLIDWACSVEYGELSRKEFFEQKPEEPVLMRFFAEVTPPHESVFLKGSELERIIAEIDAQRKNVVDDPLRDENFYFRLSDLDKQDSFHAIVRPGCQGARSLYRRLSEDSIRLPLQLKMVWNPEFKCSEIISIEQTWWFDLDLMDEGYSVNYWEETLVDR